MDRNGRKSGNREDYGIKRALCKVIWLVGSSRERFYLVTWLFAEEKRLPIAGKTKNNKHGKIK